MVVGDAILQRVGAAGGERDGAAAGAVEIGPVPVLVGAAHLRLRWTPPVIVVRREGEDDAGGVVRHGGGEIRRAQIVDVAGSVPMLDGERLHHRERRRPASYRVEHADALT